MTGIESISKIKSEIIQKLLFDYVKELSKKYNEYLKVNDSEIIDDDIIIYIDCKYSKDDFHDINLYKICLKDFEWKCKDFIMELERKLPLKHLLMSENFFEIDDDDDKVEVYIESCRLEFRIKKSEVYYY